MDELSRLKKRLEDRCSECGGRIDWLGRCRGAESCSLNLKKQFPDITKPPKDGRAPYGKESG